MHMWYLYRIYDEYLMYIFIIIISSSSIIISIIIIIIIIIIIVTIIIYIYISIYILFYSSSPTMVEMLPLLVITHDHQQVPISNGRFVEGSVVDLTGFNLSKQQKFQPLMFLWKKTTQFLMASLVFTKIICFMRLIMVNNYIYSTKVPMLQHVTTINSFHNWNTAMTSWRAAARASCANRHRSPAIHVPVLWKSHILPVASKRGLGPN